MSSAVAPATGGPHEGSPPFGSRVLGFLGVLLGLARQSTDPRRGDLSYDAEDIRTFAP